MAHAYGFNEDLPITMSSPTIPQNVPPTAKFNGNTSEGANNIVKHILSHINASVHSNTGIGHYPEVSQESYNHNLSNIAKNNIDNAAGKLTLCYLEDCMLNIISFTTNRVNGNIKTCQCHSKALSCPKMVLQFHNV